MRSSASPPAFVGRQGELAELTRLLETAAGSLPRVAVISGPAGSGKTALVEQFLGQPDVVSALRAGGSSRVLRASGALWEAELPSGVLGQLFRGADRPPAANSGTAACGEDLLALLTAGGEQPVVVFVDNLQWVDQPSLRALLYVVRRLVDARVLMVLAVRDGPAAHLAEGTRDLLEDPLAVRLPLGPLPPSDIRALARTVARIELSEPAAYRLADHAGGNPLHIRQLLQESPAGLWKMWQPELPAPASLVAATQARLSACRQATLELVESAAVLGLRSPLKQTAALSGVADPLSALDEAHAAALLEISGVGGGQMVGFPSALLRAAAYQCIGPARRSALHAAAAAVAEDEAAALRHRVAASPLPDRELALELEEFAARQAELGAWSTVADALLQSGQLYPTRAGREKRFLDALDAMVGAGELPRAMSYMEEVESFSASAQRDAVSGYLAILRGRQAQADELLRAAWQHCDAQTERPVAALIAQRRVLDSLARWDGDALVRWAQTAAALAEPESPAAIESEAIAGLGLAARGDTKQAEDAYAALKGRPELGAQLQRVQMGSGWLQLALDRPDTAEDELAAAVSTEFRLGSYRISLWAQAWLARAQFAVGRWDEALRTANAGISLQESVGMDLVRPLLHWTATQVHALRGERDQALAHLQRAGAGTDNYPIMLIPACLARAQVAEAQADYEGVLRAFEPLLRLDRGHGIDEPGFWPWQDVYANALVMTDRAQEAAAFLLPHEALANSRGHRSTTARLAYVRGRILAAGGDIPGAKTAFGQGLAALDGLHLPYETARVRFAFGQTLRRAGKRREATVQLREALHFFTTVRAGAYTERTERELQASGGNPPHRNILDLANLTSQERAVAALVAEGATNKQAALELYVGVKTIQYHLTRIYTKLGIASRSELAAVFSAGHASTGNPGDRFSAR